MKTFYDKTPFGFSQYVEIDLGTQKMLVISGQVAIDEKEQTIAELDLRKQAKQVFSQIKQIVEKVGGKMDDIVKLTTYMTDI